MTKITTHSYRAAHGREPRGRGAWCFCPASMINRDDYLRFVVWAPGHYWSLTQAKAWLRAARRGHWEVCP